MDAKNEMFLDSEEEASQLHSGRDLRDQIGAHSRHQFQNQCPIVYYNGMPYYYLNAVNGVHGNGGHGNGGHGNGGHGNTGHSNAAHSNAGHGNTGQGNTGHGNAAHGNASHVNVGHVNAGHVNTGHGNAGHSNAGHGNAGHGNTGHGNAGHGNGGHGNGSHGNGSHGNAGHGNGWRGNYRNAPRCDCHQRVWYRNPQGAWLTVQVQVSRQVRNYNYNLAIYVPAPVILLPDASQQMCVIQYYIRVQIQGPDSEPEQTAPSQ